MSGPQDFVEAVRKVVGDKPVYLVAGASDLVNEKLRGLPEAINSLQSEYKEFPLRAAGAVVGQFFRANLKVGELYDDLTRRGEEVVAKMRGDEVVPEEDEPFVREPFLPEPVHPSPPPAARAEKAPAKPPPANKTPAKAAPGKAAPAKKAPAKKAPGKNASAKNAPATKAPAQKRSSPRPPTTEA